MGIDHLARACAGRTSRRALLGTLAATFLTLPASAESRTTRKPRPAPCLQTAEAFQSALTNAHSGDTIRLCAGTFTGAFETGQPVQLTIVGAGASKTTIDGGLAGRPLSFAHTGSAVTLQGMTLTRGAGEVAGGGVYNAGTMTVASCVVTGNSADSQGGGLYNSGSLTLKKTKVTANSTVASGGLGGGVFNEQGARLTVIAKSVIGGATPELANAADRGGGLANEGTATFATGTKVTGNRATPGFGGGIYNDGTVTLATTSIVTNNTGDACAGPQPVAKCIG